MARFGNKYYENLNVEEEIPGFLSHLSGCDLSNIFVGRHRWMEFSQVRNQACCIPRP
jgi:hypothetical protein